MSGGVAGTAFFALQDVERLANAFAHQHLSEYTAEIRKSGRTFARKEVNDALWGTIGLTPIEVALLDSPLLQRLRYVRQLGVIHWIYPGAVHTRFEHTLGVLHQVHHLTSALNSVAAAAPEASTGALISPSYAQLLRLCALVHDVGHAAFSHVSEMAIEALPTMTAITAEFAKKEGGEQKQLSEIFAYYVVRSPAMSTFFDLMLDRSAPELKFETDRRRNLEQIIEKASSAIIGRKIDDQLPLLHELISGPFDADKLDYFVRDAKLAGTPSLLDISRLVQKLTVRYLDSKELPGDIGRSVRTLPGKHCLFGIKWSGVAVLDELQLARVLLYAKIYRHPKVVAIEQMMRAAIITMAKVASVDRLLKLLYTHADDALLTMSKEALAGALDLKYDELPAQQQQWLQLTESTLRAVRERRLWVRAFHIAVRYPSDPLAQDTGQKYGLVSFIEQVEHPQNRTGFTDALIAEVETVLKAIQSQRVPSREELHASIMVNVLNSTAPGGTQIARAYVLPSKGTPIPFREYVVNRSGWADSYLSDQPKGYIFCPPDIADAVYIAVERLVRVTHDVRLPPTALELSKRDASLIEKQKRMLLTQGYYRTSPIDVRPMPTRLENADVAGIVQRFDQRVRSAYQEPQGNESTIRQPTDGRTMMWLRQFDDEAHIDCALRLLDSFRLIQRGDIVQALKTFVEKFPEFRGAYLVPFGSARDSSAVHTYFAADLEGSAITKCVTVDELANAPDDVRLIFLDDFAVSGNQTTDVLAAGLGYIEDRKDLGEQRSLFDDKVRRLLSSNRIGFVYAAAWDQGMENVRTAAQKWKINAEVFRLLDETQIPFAKSVLKGVREDVVQGFLNRCQEIGRQLILNSAQGQDEEAQRRAAEKSVAGALGYGNRGMLIASHFNVPTQTLTAMWNAGHVDGAHWMPLLSRRKKS
uniref:phosphoribosyltransferase-like protein n=1 Tax=unclassified Variovorax TaxID=663243 RepID=UPI000D3B9D50